MGFPSPSTAYYNLQIVRASAALAGAGAWDAAPLVLPCPVRERLILFLSYTRGAAGGAFDFQLQFSPYSADAVGVQSWFNQSEFSAAVLAAGLDSQSRLQREYVTYQSQGAAIENVVYGPVDLGASVERVRMVARESGVVGNPGTLHAVATFFYGQME